MASCKIGVQLAPSALTENMTLVLAGRLLQYACSITSETELEGAGLMGADVATALVAYVDVLCRPDTVVDNAAL